MYKSLLTTCVLFPTSLLCIHNNLTAQLSIRPGASMIANGTASIVINNTGLSNEGSISSTDGTIVFTGSSATESTFFNSSSAVNNITVNKTAGGLMLMGNINTGNTVQLAGGVLDLNGFDLNLGTTGAIAGESATTYITGLTGGAVVRSVTLNAPQSVDPGGLGIEITSSSDLGSTTIRRGHKQQVTVNGKGINRYFDISPTNNTNINATVKFKYFDAELAGITEDELNLFSSSDNGASWQLRGVDALDAGANGLTKNNLASFARLTLGSSINNSLPVKLIGFTAALSGDVVRLEWKTSSEDNSDHFSVERSDNGIDYAAFASLPSAGNRTGIRSYSTIDRTSFTGIRYYRLKQVDRDGAVAYSAIVTVNKVNAGNKPVSVFPNPAKGPVHIKFVTATAGEVSIRVTDGNGHTVLSHAANTIAGLNNVEIDISKLAAGVYVVNVKGITAKAIRLVKLSN